MLDWPDLVTVVFTVWLLWPQRLAGYGLGHDMVFTPNQPLNAGSVGLGSTPPRAVPLDALVALTSRVLGGEITGRIALTVPLLLVGWGAVRLADQLHQLVWPARLLIAGFAVWNPFVVERLALGQWALLWCYGALPWLIRAAGRRSWTGLVLALAACAITPTGAVIGAVVAVVTGWSALSDHVGRVRLVGLAVLVQLPWLLPAVTSASNATSDPRAVAAFAARSERPGGAVFSLLGLGGIWSADVTPGSRAGGLGYLTTIAVLVAVLAGARFLPSRLNVLAAVGFVLAVLATVPGGAAVVRWLVGHVPGAGLLRDGQKWLLPTVLVAVLALGLALDRLLGLLTERLSTPAWALAGVVAAVLPLLLLPDGPATLKTPLTPVEYPSGWRQVAQQVKDTKQTVLVLPFASYRSFAWAPGRSVLDPAPRLLDAPVLVDDQLVVGAEVITGEDPAVENYLKHPNDLAGQGIGWVVVERDTPGPTPTDLSRLTKVVDADGVQLYRVPGPIHAPPGDRGRAILVITVDLLIALLVLLATLWKAGVSMSRLREDQ